MAENFVPYRASDDPELVTVPDGTYLMIEGGGAPGEKEFQSAIQTLYSLAYPIKFASKKAGKDYKVPPLEGLWYTDKDEEFPPQNPELWKWTLLIAQPVPVSKHLFATVMATARDKRPDLPYDRVQLKRFHEGTCVQIMHHGPYDAEMATIERMREYSQDHHLKPTGYHHEIYLGDPRRSKPENLRTILRQPVAKL